jgi:hypothetical protein
MGYVSLSLQQSTGESVLASSHTILIGFRYIFAVILSDELQVKLVSLTIFEANGEESTFELFCLPISITVYNLLMIVGSV